MRAAVKSSEGNNGLGRITRSIVDAIGIGIVTGQHRPNELLPVEAAMAARYEASRSVLREAIKVLNAKGLVTARPRAGTFVTPPSEWNLFDPDVLRWTLYGGFSLPLLIEFTEVRLGIEPMAAALAASRADEENIILIEKGYDRMVAAELGQDDRLASDVAFHLAILDASGNRFYRRLKPLVSTALHFSIGLTNTLSHDHDVKLEAHRRVLLAIKQRDPPSARAALELLLLETRALMRGAHPSAEEAPLVTEGIAPIRPE
jgi:DNA-binding FadR family transcriptional regulator